MPATHSGDQPLYEVVRAGILERLHRGEWSAGTKIPTEPQLAQQFGVGIGTIRRAVEDLVAERLLIRRAGRGTVVARITDQHAFDLYFSFVDARGEPVKAGARLLRFSRERATPELATALQLERGARVARAENLRLLGNVPVMLDRIWIPAEVFPELDAKRFSSRPGSIYGFYQEQYGVTVVRVVETLGAEAAEAEMAQTLGLAPGAPLLRIQRTAYSYKDRPVEYRVRYADSTRCAYRNSRGLQD